jgi:hypothetical protein
MDERKLPALLERAGIATTDQARRLLELIDAETESELRESHEFVNIGDRLGAPEPPPRMAGD